MSGKMAKNKGANAEREVAKILQPIIDEVYESVGLESPTMKRNLEQTRGGGYDLVGIDWMALEIKRQENLSIESWWKQTIKQTLPGQVPVLMYRQNNKKWKVLMMGAIRSSKTSAVSMRVEISLNDFLRWFTTRAMNELKLAERP